MNDNELRVGNYVYSADGQFGRISFYGNGFGAFTDLRGPVSLQECSPIPLTPELLKKCGFNKSTDQFGGYLSPKFQDAQFKLRFLKDEFSWYLLCLDSVFIIRLPYLHQLQNLYFALTGKELKINL